MIICFYRDAENQFITSKLPGMRDEGVTDVYIGISGKLFGLILNNSYKYHIKRHLNASKAIILVKGK